MFRSFSLMLLAAALLGTAGCQSCCRRPVSSRTAVVPGTPCCPPGNMTLPPPPAPLGGAPSVKVIQPPPAFPGPNVTPPPPALGPAVPAPPVPSVTPVPGSVSQLPPRLEPNWQPAEARGEPSRVVPATPDPLLGTPGSGDASPKKLPAGPKLYPPEVEEKSTAEPPLIQEKTQPHMPPAVEEKKSSSLPAGIVGFTPTPIKGVFTGERPSIDDGFNWLAKHGYKTVLHVRTEGSANDADRKQVDLQGMTYITLEVSPKTLSRNKIEEFTKLVREPGRQPMFVYDQDGVLVGPLWYLYFRTVDNDTDELARIKANRLGLREDRDGAHRDMWLAVQNYLKDNP